MDVFYEMKVKNYRDSNALIWRYNEKEKFYTFESIYIEANQFLNFLRTHGIKKGDCIYSQLPLEPANWISLLATIMGGLVLIPSSTNLTEKDIAYRFKIIFPEVVISDLSNTTKIDAAEKLLNKSIKVKIIVDGEAEGWHNIDKIHKEDKIAEAAHAFLSIEAILPLTSALAKAGQTNEA